MDLPSTTTSETNDNAQHRTAAWEGPYCRFEFGSKLKHTPHALPRHRSYFSATDSSQAIVGARQKQSSEVLLTAKHRLSNCVGAIAGDKQAPTTLITVAIADAAPYGFAYYGLLVRVE